MEKIHNLASRTPQILKLSPESMEEVIRLRAVSESPYKFFEIALMASIGKFHSKVAEAYEKMWDEGIAELTSAPSMKVLLGRA